MSIKFLIHVTAYIKTDINADNLRGEPRWERNVLDAFVSEGYQTHTTMNVWNSDKQIPNNLYDGYNSEWADDSVLITYGVPKNPNIPVKAKYYVVHYLECPTEDTKNLFLDYHKENPGSIIATCNFKAWNYISNLEKTLGKDKVEWVQGPMVPCVYNAVDNFGKPSLLWLFRNFWYCAEQDPCGMKSLFGQISSYLKDRNDLELNLIIGAWDQWAFADRGTSASITNWVFSYPFMKNLLQYKDRIHIHFNLNWHEVLNLISKSHLVISPPEPFGNPPYEAAMYGIPTILQRDTNPFQDSGKNKLFSELLATNNGRNVDSTFLTTINRLYTDHSFYRSIGDAYRNYVNQWATYEAYIRQIKTIMDRRGWK